MTEIEKIQRYIARTKIGGSDRYCLTYCEAAELGGKARENDDRLLEILELMFNYGRAKGYRAAKKEAWA